MNARALPDRRMPKFLRKALKRGLISLSEAQMWAAACNLQRRQREITLPERLGPALDRLWLDQEANRNPPQ